MKSYRCRWWIYANRHLDNALEYTNVFEANSDQEAVEKFKSFKAMKEAEDADPNNFDGYAVEDKLVRIDQEEIIKVIQTS